MPADYFPGQKVELEIMHETPLGFVAKINGVDEGLLYHNEIFERFERGQQVPGYIKKVRADGGIDLLLQPFGHHGMEDLGEQILAVLRKENGFLPLNDKAPAEKVYDTFGVSKKKFKMAIGGLYKKRLIKITEKGIELEAAAATKK